VRGNKTEGHSALTLELRDRDSVVDIKLEQVSSR
jgi:hypothetical protein